VAFGEDHSLTDAAKQFVEVQHPVIVT